MATTTGFVQRVTILPLLAANIALCCVWIGPTPSNAALLLIRRENTDSDHAGSFKATMVNALVSAMVNRQEVIVTHGDSDSLITTLRVEPS